METDKFLEWQSQFQGTDIPSQLWEKIEKLQAEIVELKAENSDLKDENRELADRLQEGRDFLMQSCGSVYIDEALVAFGWSEDGF